MKLCIHPDDPPINLLGLPRIMSKEDDMAFLLKEFDSKANGFTFCTGSLGAGPNNDVVSLIEKFGHRIYFLHLRNIIKEMNGSFYESGHAHGDLDMAQIVALVSKEENRRKGVGLDDWQIPVRADHGLNYIGEPEVAPGYGAAGRAKGLEEILDFERLAHK